MRQGQGQGQASRYRTPRGARPKKPGVVGFTHSPRPVSSSSSSSPKKEDAGLESYTPSHTLSDQTRTVKKNNNHPPSRMQVEKTHTHTRQNHTCISSLVLPSCETRRQTSTHPFFCGVVKVVAGPSGMRHVAT
ncbi:hypothetical protein IF1G_04825 [Cordyceps javanica]|uniref:Uncharacterized protein n=1 Tax=Cordyceps javanica TaxID=43265 RepID=A0A545V3F1_9HYPO|nr:hypothetical protein IF1G_04825 [Cordyceps javanica]